MDNDVQRHGQIGVAIVLLTCTSHLGLHRIVPISFGDDVMDDPRNEKWLEKLRSDARTGTIYWWVLVAARLAQKADKAWILDQLFEFLPLYHCSI